MTLSYDKLKTALPKATAKLTKLGKDRKAPSLSFTKPKAVGSTASKPFDFNKFTKVAKAPKAPKLAIMKKAIKKVKNAGY